MNPLLKRCLRLSPGETSFERRGFRVGDSARKDRLERAGAAFVLGYNAVLDDSRFGQLTPRLEAVPADFRGFAYEGAAMGLALLDWLTPWNRQRIDAFLRGPGDPHAYMVHVGAGWVLARVPGRVENFLRRFDPLLRWLVMDGYGFHEAFFHGHRYLAGAPMPSRVQGYARRAFDQGFGRCLWFVEGAEPDRIAATIANLASGRHGDLWSGVGLAAVYAGQIAVDDLESLRRRAGLFGPALAQGASFAAKARQRAGNLTSYQDLACGVLCGMSAIEAARVSDQALENLPEDGLESGYEVWRRRIQDRFQPAVSVVPVFREKVHR